MWHKTSNHAWCSAKPLCKATIKQESWPKLAWKHYLTRLHWRRLFQHYERRQSDLGLQGKSAKDTGLQLRKSSTVGLAFCFLDFLWCLVLFLAIWIRRLHNTRILDPSTTMSGKTLSAFHQVSMHQLAFMSIFITPSSRSLPTSNSLIVNQIEELQDRQDY